MSHLCTMKYSSTDSALITSLITLSKKSPKLVKSSIHPAPADPNITVRSWKMNEFKYYDIPSPFPTLARGLFSVELPTKEGAAEQKHRIVARGYDKFFNIGEVPWTTWPALEANTVPPYTLSLKSNGCIIFITALTPTKLLITSKHSLGPLEGAELSHAQVGERWLRKYLEQKDRKEEDLAGVLWDKNWTAVAELCDDSFEEHVLPYPAHLTGLHLHGLNESCAAFRTMPQTVVDEFAEEWGFIRTRSTVLPSIPAVRDFTEEISKTGVWEGEAVEGFVVRSIVGEPPRDDNKAERSPYEPGSSFFFKVKFDEPYMMYRDWREITKMLISTMTSSHKASARKGPVLSGLSSTSALLASLPKRKMNREETKKYAEWVCEEIKTELQKNNGRLGEHFGSYTKGKGIIRTRERFLEWVQGHGGLKNGKTSIIEGTADTMDMQWGKTIIVPMAIPGCGKTAVSVALAHIFGFGHTQSDDVHGKKAAPVFVSRVVDLLKGHDVVIADKNNHLKQQREALREATASMDPPVRLLALNWNHALFPTPSVSNPSPLSLTTIHRLVSSRIVSRGENHQTLVADPTKRSHEDVVWQFIEHAEDLGEGECDEVIEMRLEENLDKAVRRAVDGCCRILALEQPSEEKVMEGLDKARCYVPRKTKQMEGQEKGKTKKKESEVRYYALLPELDVQSVIDHRLAGTEGFEDLRTFWDHLKDKQRVTKRPHVTLVHCKSLPNEQSAWDLCKAVDLLEGEPPLFSIKLGKILWDGGVMALTVDNLEVHQTTTDDAPAKGRVEVQSFLSGFGNEIGNRLHVTVGTRDDTVLPVEAIGLVETWRLGNQVQGKDVGVIELDRNGQGLVVVGRIRGMFH